MYGDPAVPASRIQGGQYMPSLFLDGGGEDLGGGERNHEFCENKKNSN